MHQYRCPVVCGECKVCEGHRLYEHYRPGFLYDGVWASDQVGVTNGERPHVWGARVEHMQGRMQRTRSDRRSHDLHDGALPSATLLRLLASLLRMDGGGHTSQRLPSPLLLPPRPHRSMAGRLDGTRLPSHDLRLPSGARRVHPRRASRWVLDGHPGPPLVCCDRHAMLLYPCPPHLRLYYIVSQGVYHDHEVNSTFSLCTLRRGG